MIFFVWGAVSAIVKNNEESHESFKYKSVIFNDFISNV